MHPIPGFFLLFVALAGSLAHAAPTVRVGVLTFGTVNWELDTIRHHALDRAHGIVVEVVPLASKNATSVALQGGAVELIVSDWIWVSRQRATGHDYAFFPFSKTVGGLLLDPAKQVSSVADLPGRRIGIAGGPVDKTWLLLQAYARQKHQLTLTEVMEPVFAAPPVLNQLVLKGDVDGVVTFWHFAARLKAKQRWVELHATDMLRALGVDGEVPLLGWVFAESWAQQNRPAIDGFLRASYAAKAMLLTSDDEWRRLAPQTRARDDATLHAYRDGYRAGVPGPFGPDELAAAARTFAILAREGGAKLVGESVALQPGTFWQHSDVSYPK